MILLPFATTSIDSPLEKGDVVLNLTRNIEPERIFDLRGTDKPFRGRLRGNEFEVTNVINYRNVFLPTVFGRLYTAGSGTRITLNMKVSVLAIIFMSAWCISCMAGIWISAFNPSRSNVHPIMPAGMLVFGFAVMILCYAYEANRSKQILCELTQGEISRVRELPRQH